MRIADVAQAAFRILDQTPLDQPSNNRGCIRRQCVPLGVAFEHNGERVHDRAAAKRRTPRQHLVE